MCNLAAIVLAAGKGTMMKSRLPKVLHTICGRPMLYYPLEVLKGLGPGKVVVVVGHGSGLVMDSFDGHGVSFTIQEPQLGTAHAVKCGFEEHLKGFQGDVLILSGDTPLVTPQTIKGLMQLHRRGGPETVLSFVTALVDDPAGYGRVVRDGAGAVERIVEERDADSSERAINEINAGIYLVDSAFLSSALKRVSRRNAQKEFYLTDLISLARGMNKRVSALTHFDPEEVMGVNTRRELARAESVMRRRILETLMDSGVTIRDPQRTYIDYGVKVGRDTTVYPGVHLLGSTTIGRDVTIEEGVRIIDSSVGAGTVVKSYSVLESSTIGRDSSIGPFARLRPGNVLGNRVRIGNFVEVKNSNIGSGSKANHLSYIGDSDVGRNVNIGAGTITCNYDGIKKYRTIIEDNVFVGSDTQLVAPVRIGRRAYIGSGSTITKDVPPGALAVSRVEQRVVEGWVKKKFSGRKKKKGS